MNGTQAFILSRRQFSTLGTAAYKDVGVPNGVAELDDSGIVLSSQLPSYVDDVIEYPSVEYFPAVGESGKIYVDTTSNKSYRWTGSTYIVIASDLALGETSSTAYRGDRGKLAFDHSQVTSGNPHNVTKTDIGLSNVENKSSATIRSELTKSNVTTALGYTPAQTDTTYSFKGGTNKFTVTPSGGTAFDVTVTPSIANNITGSGTSGYIAKFNGANSITNGPAFGSDTSKYLRNDGSWVKPPNDNTTYTIATGDSNGQIKVTPSSGSAYNVSIKGLGSLAYKSSLSYSDVGAAASSHTHDDRYYTESEINTKLNGKSDTGHTHDDRYYTESEVDTKLNGKAASSHTHDDRYYTESEVDTKLNGKSDVGHTHDYVPLSGASMNDGAVLQFYHNNVRRIKISDSIQFFPVVPAPGTNDAYLINSTNSLAQLDINADQVNFYQRNNQGTTTTKTMIKLFGSGGANNMTTNIRTDRHYLNLCASMAVQCVTNDDSGWVDLNCKKLHENSSKRYKDNIQTLTETEAKKLLSLRPVTFDYKSGETGQRGLIAEEVDKVIPGAVSYKTIDGVEVPDGLSYTTFIPYLIKMIQMQQEEISKLKTRL